VQDEESTSQGRRRKSAEKMIDACKVDAMTMNCTMRRQAVQDFHRSLISSPLRADWSNVNER
jgi:hypothetical protein